MPRFGLVRLMLALWVLAIAAGFGVLVDYEQQPGQAAAAPPRWPAEAGLPFDRARINLVMFAHPQCPCSRASMAELEIIMSRCGDRVRATVCFSDPDREPATWTQSALWRRAAAIPGVQTMADPNGQIAARFASATSGQVFLFDREGRRIFSGGITGGRGHEGENRGRALVIALASGELCDGNATAVYGCARHDPVARTDGE
jgi:hypothetical protein